MNILEESNLPVRSVIHSSKIKNHRCRLRPAALRSMASNVALEGEFMLPHKKSHLRGCVATVCRSSAVGLREQRVWLPLTCENQPLCSASWERRISRVGFRGWNSGGGSMLMQLGGLNGGGMARIYLTRWHHREDMHNGDPCHSTFDRVQFILWSTQLFQCGCSDRGKSSQSTSHNIRCCFEASASYRYQSRFL